MPLNSLQSTNFSFIDKKQLAKFKCKAIRAGVWFKVLPRIDRVLIDLAIKVAKNIRNTTLANSILSVTMKLEGLLENKFSRAIKEIGFPLARKIGLQAIRWGNNQAQSWVDDMGFARFLATMKLNGHPPCNG